MTSPSSASDGCVSSASWTCGIELAVGRDLLEALALERGAQLAGDERDALLELRLLVLAGGDERPLEIVDDREHRLHQPLVGARDQVLLVTRGPLAVVVELGRDPLQLVEVVVALGLDGGEPLLQLLGLDGLLLLLRHYCLASSSITS